MKIQTPFIMRWHKGCFLIRKLVGGMNMKKRPLRIQTICLATVILLIVLTACQPTPDKAPVVNKGDTSLEEKIKENEGANTDKPAEKAENIKHSFTKGKLSVNIDAQVEYPEVSKIPVVKVKPDKFNQDQVDRIIKTLMQGKPIYKPSNVMTKAQLEEELILLRKMLSEMTQENDGEKGKMHEGSKKKIEIAIEDIEKRIATAPEEVEKEPSDGKLQDIGRGAQEVIVTAELGKKKDAQLSVFVSESGKISNVWFSNQEGMFSYLAKQSPLDKAPRGVSMTREEAEALAIKTVEDMGCDLKLAAVRLGTAGGMGITSDSNGEGDEAPQAYVFWFTRAVDGVRTTYEVNDGSMVDLQEGDASQYFEPYPYERLYVCIDDTGIVELQWTSPIKVLERISENVQMIPFDEVMEIFEKQFFIRNALKEDEDEIKQSTYTIDRITLGLVRVPVKDQSDEYLLVPVWDFFGKRKVEFNDPQRQPEEYDHTDESFLTINAIDGSVINRSKGAGAG